MLNKVLYRKDPRLHAFYIDFDKKRFYKCYREDTGQSRYDFEVQCYSKLEGSKFVPKIYNTFKKNDLLVIEMEYIPRLPLYEHPGIRKSLLWKNVTYTKEQIQSIHRQFDELREDLAMRGLVDIKGNIHFTFSFFHFIYNELTDRLTMFDLAITSPRSIKYLIQCMHEETDKKLVVADKGTSRAYTDEEMFRELLFPKSPESEDNDREIYEEGEILIRDIEKAQKYFSSVYINGKLVRDKANICNSGGILDLSIGKDELVNKYVMVEQCGLGGVLCNCIERGAKEVIGIQKDFDMYELCIRYINYIAKIHPVYKQIFVSPHSQDTAKFDKIIEGDLVNEDNLL